MRTAISIAVLALACACDQKGSATKVGTAVQKSSQRTWKADPAERAKLKTRHDKFAGTTSIEAPPVTADISSLAMWLLSAEVARADGSTSWQVMCTLSTPFYEARTEHAEELRVQKMPRGEAQHYAAAVHLDRKHVEDAAREGLEIRYRGNKGRAVIHITAPLARAMLVEVDEVRADLAAMTKPAQPGK